MPLVVPAKVRMPDTRALPRGRLEARLMDAFDRRLTLVIAPAGSGKTTLLAQFAATCGAPAGWYRAETWDADEASFVRHVEASLGGVVPGLRGGWAGVEDAARSLEARAGSGPVLLVIDDLHALEGTAAESAFGRFVDYAPPWLAIVAASRVVPGMNLSRMRVAGELLELGSDDLRFRAWEVEQLYREVYRDPVPPMVLAALARRTEGWAAGLQLFHLASRGKPLEERQRLLSGIGSRSRLVREYLARNVLAELPPELRDFLRETCVLGRLSGTICDRYLGSTGSAALLDELARRQVFTVPVEDADDVYRYHEVLRSHLDRILVGDLGEDEARRRYARAAELLEGHGALAEALTAWCRAEDWDAVERLLHRGGERLAHGTTSWLDNLPPALVRHDPWLALAAARSARSEGQWTVALDWYARAESGFGAAAAADHCRTERGALTAWLDPGAMPPPGWLGLLHSGLVREPLTAAREADDVDDAHRPVVRGLLRLAAGDIRGAARTLQAAADSGLADASLAAVVALGLAVGDLLAGERRALGSFAAAVEAAERAGMPWLARIGRAVAHQLAGVDPASDRAVRPGPDDLPGWPAEDAWGAALVALAQAWISGQPRAGSRQDTSAARERRIRAADGAATLLRRLGIGTLESWAHSLAALGRAEQGTLDARDAASSAEALARATGSSGSRLVAYRALAVADPARAAEHARQADNLERETGISIAGHGSGGREQAADTEPAARAEGAVIDVCLLGGFQLTVDGQALDLDGVKPRARALLRLLSLHAPAPVHREVLQEALWSDADAATGTRSLQVCISTLRGSLSAAAAPEAGRLVARVGDAYRLAVPADAVDLRRFERALAAGRMAGSSEAAVAGAYQAALDLYRGDLLPEDGPADWVVARRDQLRLQAVEAAQAIAEAAMAAGDAQAAIRACRRGLEVNRYDDSLWRLLIDAREQAGEAGAASRDRREYHAVLAGLGVDGAGLASRS